MKSRSLSLCMVLIALAAGSAGCGKGKDKDSDQAPKKLGATPPAPAPTPTPPPAAAMDPAAEAQKTFDTVCAACHGTSGKGDGAAAATLNPKPRNYTDGAWQASVTDADLAKIISEGGAAVGKSPIMPANPTLKPEVIQALVKKVRSFAPAGTAPAAGAPAAAPAATAPAATPTPAPKTPAPK